MRSAPVAYSPDVETVRPEAEAEIAQKIETLFRSIVSTTHRDYGHAMRGVHAKAYALLEGELIVKPDLDETLAQGIFSERGRRYPLLLRMSSIAGDPLSDGVSLPRGMAIKVVGVEGDRLPGSEGENTQDFLLATAAPISPNAKGFLNGLRLVAPTTDRFEWAKVALSAVMRPLERLLARLGAGGFLTALGGYPNTNPIGDRYYTQLPLRFGRYMAKFDLVPESANFRALTGARIDISRDPNAIRHELARIFPAEGGSWTLRAQLCRDLAANPIENASVLWPETDNPYLPVASISVPPQQSWTPERVAAIDERTIFRPWHGIEAHRPLGQVMRARRAVYPAVQAYRSELNGCPFHEPASLPLSSEKRKAAS